MKIYITYTKNSFTEKQVEELSKGGGACLFRRYFCFRYGSLFRG